MILKPFEDQQDTAFARFGAPQIAPSFTHAPYRHGACRLRLRAANLRDRGTGIDPIVPGLALVELRTSSAP